MGIFGGERGPDGQEGGPDSWKEGQGHRLWGPSGLREAILQTWGLGYVCGVGGDSGIKGKGGRRLMELNRAMQDLPLPETLLSVILFF